MGSIAQSEQVDHLDLDDFIVVIVDGCVRRISKVDFLNGVVFGGFNACEALLGCFEEIGTIPGTIIPPTDNKPKMGNVVVSLDHGVQDYQVTETQFTSQFTDVDGDELAKIIISHGDFSGFTLNGSPIYAGQVINRNQLSDIEYDTKNTINSYNQKWYFETYDQNNVKADPA